MGKAYRSNKYGGLYSDTFNTPVGRFFWMYVAKPKTYRGPVDPGKAPPTPKYEASIAFPKDDPKTKVLIEKVTLEVSQMVAAFNVGKKTKLGEVQIFQDGDENQEFYTKYPWVKGCYYMTARTGFAPGIVDRAGDEYAAADLQGGMKGKIAFQCCVSNGGLSFTLEGIQFWEDDGTRFGGTARTASQLFDACDEEPAQETARPTETGVSTAPSSETASPATTKGQKGKSALVNML